MDLDFLRVVLLPPDVYISVILHYVEDEVFMDYNRTTRSEIVVDELG